MNIGMLWFDNDPKAGLDVKIERAVTYYRTKYGKTPTLCFVHPSMMPSGAASDPNTVQSTGNAAIRSAGVEVRSTRSVLPNHFWIGVNGASSGAD